MSDKNLTILKWFEKALEIEPSIDPDTYKSLLDQAYIDFSNKKANLENEENRKYSNRIIFDNLDHNTEIYQSHLIMSTYNGEDYLRKNLKSLIDTLNKVNENILFSLYLDASNDGSEKFILDIVNNSYLKFDIRIIGGNTRIGHIKGMQMVMKGVNSIITGYIDDDAIPVNFTLNQILSQAHKYGSVGGTCIDDNSKSTPLGKVLSISSNSNILNRLPDKLMYHGGGGITFVKTKLFAEAISKSIESSCLLGPMLSGIAFKNGIIPYSNNQLLTHHPNRVDLREWVYMIGRYRESWKKVYDNLGEEGFYFRALYKSHTHYREIMVEHLLRTEVHTYRFMRALRKFVDDELIELSRAGHRLNYIEKK